MQTSLASRLRDLNSFHWRIVSVALAGQPTEKLLLGGFSQGACLALEYVARQPRRYGAVAALSGGLIGADGELTQPQGLGGTPLLITVAEDDDWVPVRRSAAPQL